MLILPHPSSTWLAGLLTQVFNFSDSSQTGENEIYLYRVI